MTAKLFLSGDKAIDNMLATLEPKLQKKAIRTAARQATKDIVLPDAKRLVPVKTGLLKRALTVRTAKGQGGKRLPRTVLGFAVTFRDKFFTGESFYGAFLEFGTKHIDPVRFLRRALYENRAAIISVFRARLAEQIRQIAAETRAKTKVK